jgi:hypothetical protein
MRRDRRRVKVQTKEHRKMKRTKIVSRNTKKKEKKWKRRRVSRGRKVEKENSTIYFPFHVPAYTVHKMITAQNRRLPDTLVWKSSYSYTDITHDLSSCKDK